MARAASPETLKQCRLIPPPISTAWPCSVNNREGLYPHGPVYWYIGATRNHRASGISATTTQSFGVRLHRL